MYQNQDLYDCLRALLRSIHDPNWKAIVQDTKKSIRSIIGKELPFLANDILERILDPFMHDDDRLECIRMLPMVLGVELYETKQEEPKKKIIDRSPDTNTDVVHLTEEPHSVHKDIVLRDISLEQARERIYDFSLETEERIQAIKIVFKDNPVEFEQVLARLVSMLDLSNVSMINEYLLEICSLDIIPIEQRYSAINKMCESDIFQEHAYKLLATLCKQRPPSDRVPLVLYVEQLFRLVKYDREKYTPLIDAFLQDSEIDEQCRYSYLVKSRVSVGMQFWIEYVQKILEQDIFNIRYRIICCSDMMSVDTIDASTRNDIIARLCTWMNDTSLDMNTRADAADLVMTHADNDLQTKARDVLMTMGTHGLGILSTLYDNKQNAHFTNTERNVKKIMRQLMEMDVQPTTTPFEVIRDRLFQSYFGTRDLTDDKTRAQVSAFEFSLFRITNQVGTVIGGYTLLDIFLYVYGYIEENRYQEYIEIRLVEELIDMSDTCTTGYYSRLVNTLPGYGPFQMTIDWGSQIQANLIGRLRACIRDDEKIDKLLEELTEDSFVRKHELRRVYLENISRIREEMQVEFAPYIDATDFDLYFRKALIHFEGGD